MILTTILTIDGVDYNAAARAAAGIVIDEVGRTIDGYDIVSFHRTNTVPDELWKRSVAVSLTATTTVAGSPPVVTTTTVFTGQLREIAWQPRHDGHWTIGYTAFGLRFLADQVPVEKSDGTGTVIYNRSPEDPYYAPSDAGLPIGTILTRILTVPATAARLNALGIGAYTLPALPAPQVLALPAATIADLVLLTIVPPSQVIIQGEQVLAQTGSLVERWMSNFVQELTPDGTLRYKDTTDLTVFVPVTLTLPGIGGPGDSGVNWPSVRSSTARCATRVVMRGGADIAVAQLATSDGTLVQAATTGQINTWTLYDFTQPKDAVDTGTLSAVTSTSASVTSANHLTTWALNFWSSREALIYMEDPAAVGIDIFETRTVTSCTAMTAGGTASVTWDASQPLDNNTYTSYRLMGTAGGLADVWRLYDVCEPATGKTGLDTWIGSHIELRSPLPITYANNTKTIAVFYTSGSVVGGTVPVETPLGVEPVISEGAFRFVQPTVTVNGQPSKLNLGSPTKVADGLPVDVRVLVLYSRGALSAIDPADTLPVVGPPAIPAMPVYSGTAYTADGLEVTKYFDFPTWNSSTNTASMALLAAQELACLQDTAWEGEGVIYGTDALPSDFFLFNYSLNYAIDGASSPFTAMNAPIRGITLRFGTGPGGPGSFHIVSYRFSNVRRAFSGADLYTHPAFTYQGPISQMQGAGGMFGTGYMPSSSSSYGGSEYQGDDMGSSDYGGSGGEPPPTSRPRPKPKRDPLDSGGQKKDRFEAGIDREIQSDQAANERADREAERSDIGERNYQQGNAPAAETQGQREAKEATLERQASEKQERREIADRNSAKAQRAESRLGDAGQTTVASTDDFNGDFRGD